MVVDDEPVVAALIAEALRNDGHEPLVGHTGEEALDLIQSGAPDAVFLDLVMPGFGGLELIERIVREYPDLPLVVFAGRVETRLVAHIRDLGVADIVEKPIALARLGEALRSLGKG
jgi:two-component system OmpR family response regulator